MPEAFKYLSREERQKDAELDAPRTLERDGQMAERALASASESLAEATQDVARLTRAVEKAAKKLQALVAKGYRTQSVKIAERQAAEAVIAQAEQEKRERVAEEQGRKAAEQKAARNAELSATKPLREFVVCEFCKERALKIGLYHKRANGWFCLRGETDPRVFLRCGLVTTLEMGQMLIDSGGDFSVLELGSRASLPEPKFQEAYDPGRSRVMENPSSLPVNPYTA
jgi:hypothetical protein